MLLLREGAVLDHFSQSEENVPEKLHCQNPMFPIQMFVFEAFCENLFEIPCFSGCKYPNSLGFFYGEARESQDNMRRC